MGSRRRSSPNSRPLPSIRQSLLKDNFRRMHRAAESTRRESLSDKREALVEMASEAVSACRHQLPSLPHAPLIDRGGTQLNEITYCNPYEIASVEMPHTRTRTRCSGCINEYTFRNRTTTCFLLKIVIGTCSLYPLGHLLRVELPTFDQSEFFAS